MSLLTEYIDRCIVGLPKDCQEALEFGYKTGEALILPSDNVDPFIVFCDMDSNPGRGMYPDVAKAQIF